MKLFSSLKLKKASGGFTIVELLIVIVVIGILAAIVVVAYNGVQKSAQTGSITSELKQWEKLFMAYKSINGSYPSPAAAPLTDGGPGGSVLNYYCLGTGFPPVSGTNYCFHVNSTSVWRVAESTGASLIAQLSTVGTPPQNSKKYTYGTVVGPVLVYNSATNIQLYSTYPGGTACPSGMSYGYGDASRQDCYIQLN